ncbi:MAG: hypothetical protein ACI8WB_003147 [Phenylobacterium sp.]
MGLFKKKQHKALAYKATLNWTTIITLLIVPVVGYIFTAEWVFKKFETPNPEFYFKPNVLSLPGYICIQPANDAAKNFEDDLYMTLVGLKYKVGKLKTAQKTTPNSYCNNDFWHYELTDALRLFLKPNKAHPIAFYFTENKKSDTYTLVVNQSPPSYQLEIEPAKEKKQGANQLTSQVKSSYFTGYNQGFGNVNIDFYFLNGKNPTPANVLSGIAVIAEQSFKSFDVKLDDVETIDPQDPRYYKDYLKIVYEDGSKLSSSATITYANLINGIKLAFTANKSSGQSQSLLIKSPKIELSPRSNNPTTPDNSFVVELNLVQYTMINKNKHGSPPVLLSLALDGSSYKLVWEIDKESNITTNAPATILRDGESIGVSLDNTFHDEIVTDISIDSYQVHIKGENGILYGSNIITDIPSLEVKLPEQELAKSLKIKNNLLYQFCGEVSGLIGSGKPGYGPNSRLEALRLLLLTTQMKAKSPNVLQSDEWQSKVASAQACNIIEHPSFFGMVGLKQKYIHNICCSTKSSFLHLVDILIIPGKNNDKNELERIGYGPNKKLAFQVITIMEANNYFNLNGARVERLRLLEPHPRPKKSTYYDYDDIEFPP